MPATLTYPGVYIEEIPSGVRTITGVATSITAFIGRARRGPVNEAVTINSYGDFERIFGGLWVHSMLGYAVRDFYLNGGSQAIIVRLFNGDVDAATVEVSVGGLTLAAASPGIWGRRLRAGVQVGSAPEDVAVRLGVAAENVFNLTVAEDAPGGATERFLNVTVVDSPRRLDRVLEAESRLVRLEDDLDVQPADLPKPKDGEDPVTAAEAAAKKDLPDLEKQVREAKDGVKQAQEALEATEESDPGADTSAEEQAVEDAKNVLKAAEDEVADAKKAVTDAVEALGGSDGGHLAAEDIMGSQADKTGLYALEQADLFNLLCLPPYKPTGLTFDVDPALISVAASYCEERRAFLIVDSPSSWGDKHKAVEEFSNDTFPGIRSKNAAIFFPRIRQPNPLRDGQIEEFAPCGVVAGVFARTDTQRGVWKAPAGIETSLLNVPQLAVNLTDLENGELNQLGVNCLRAFPIIGRVSWGARTLRGADQLADEWKYIPVRRTALFIEESLYRGTKWVVFEPNDEPLWAQIRLNVGAFMHGLFRQGAFQGQKPRDAYFVKCDRETTTQNDINRGVVNIVVGFAPLKPAEFVVIQIQQMAGEIET